MTAYAIAGTALALTALLMFAPSAWQRANRKLDTILADDTWLDEDHDAAMAAACEREAWLLTRDAPTHDRLWLEVLDASLDNDGRGRWSA